MLFTVSFAAMFGLWVRDMRIEATDREWLRAIRHYAVHDKEKVPDAGKYNGGQKLFFWSISLLGVLVPGQQAYPCGSPRVCWASVPFYGTARST